MLPISCFVGAIRNIQVRRNVVQETEATLLEGSGQVFLEHLPYQVCQPLRVAYSARNGIRRGTLLLSTTPSAGILGNCPLAALQIFIALQMSRAMAASRLHLQSSRCGHGARNKLPARRVNLSTRCSANSVDAVLPSRREIVTQSAALLAGAAILPTCENPPHNPFLFGKGCSSVKPKACSLEPATRISACNVPLRIL